MRFALVNPPWTFEGSFYFGCREPHLPLEFGYARVLLERAGHVVLLVDAHLRGLGLDEVRSEVASFAPDIAVVVTAPSYLFWRCAPPELRVPRATARALRDLVPVLAVVGPHASTTPGAVLRKLDADVAVLGECEEILPLLADWPRQREAPSTAHLDGGRLVVRGGPRASDMRALPALTWDAATLALHRHHHHRFDSAPDLPGAEVEASRGCPYHCTFCAKDKFRNHYRKRPLATVLAEIDGLLARGVGYVYFVDEIFQPDEELLRALAARPVSFGVQLRIDQWRPDQLDLLGRAGCVSIEAGVDGVSREGREHLARRCRLDSDDLAALLVHARRSVPFVQAKLLGTPCDSDEAIEEWRAGLQRRGVRADKPVPLFPYPGSPHYRALWGEPDDQAWERGIAHYLAAAAPTSDLRDARPLSFERLEAPAVHAC